MKKLLLVLGIVVVVLVCILILKDQIIKSALTSALSGMTGAPVHIDGFSLDILGSTAHVSGLKIFNPGGFPDGVLIFCPRIDVIYDRATLFKGKRHLLLVNIELAEIGLTTNKEGMLNVEALNVGQAHPDPAPLQIDLVTLGIGKIVTKDYRNGTEPAVRIHDVGRHKSFKNIPTARQLVALVMAEPMREAGIKSAQIYGVAMAAGTAVLPVAVVAAFIGKTSVRQTVDVPFERVYEVSLEALRRMGRVTRQDSAQGMIQANINGSNVTLRLKREGARTEVTIAARKYMFPRLDIAGGVLYQISEKL